MITARVHKNKKYSECVYKLLKSTAQRMGLPEVQRREQLLNKNYVEVPTSNSHRSSSIIPEYSTALHTPETAQNNDILSFSTNPQR